jgi:hypothetical protein
LAYEKGKHHKAIPKVPWKITLRYKYIPAIGHDLTPRIVFEDFVNIHELANYLRWEPERAVQIGYGKLPHNHIHSGRSSEVTLMLWFKDAHSELRAEFANVSAFARFLDSNDVIADCLNYTPKKNEF